MKTSEVLRAAKGLIEDPADWCGRGWGEHGSRCAMHALCDVLGSTAIYHMSPQKAMQVPVYAALHEAIGDAVGIFNDNHSHAEVMAAFDRAIAAEEAREMPATFPSEWTRTEVPA